MKIGIGKLILFVLCLIIFINDVWILNVFNILKDWLVIIIILSTVVSGVAVFILFLAFLIEVWEAN